MTVVKGRARTDRRTKNLVKRLQPHEIAVIAHEGIDSLAAESLVAARVRAVVNAYPSLSRDYPNNGPQLILKAGITLIDNVGEGIIDAVQDGDELEIVGDRIYRRGVRIAEGLLLTPELVQKGMDEARARVDEVLAQFVDNTLTYARQEIQLIAGHLNIPVVSTPIRGRHVLVVVRGHDYRADLQTIQSYIREVRPVLIGVDGGADALLEFGLKPDIIVGDMDSVSDATLRQAHEIVVHAYPDGRAPGLERVKNLGLTAKIFAARGTSEDIAMLLAYEKGASLIVAVGTHSNMLDFLEKGRKGMASTFLVRLKVGGTLVDARGVSQLYRSPVRPRHIAQIILAALLPMVVVIALSPPIRELLYLLYIQVRVFLGI